MIQASEKPFIFVGGGAILSGASKELKEFVEKMDAPVTDSLMGKGAFREPIQDIQECWECTERRRPIWSQRVRPVVVVGARFSDRVTGNTATFAKMQKFFRLTSILQR